MFRRLLLLTPVLGCDDREPIPTRPTAREKRGDVHIEAPGVKVDVQRNTNDR